MSMAQGTGNTPGASGVSPGTVRGIAVLAILGGFFLAGYATLMSLKPEGCGGDECIGRSYREAGPLDLLFLAGAVLISAAAAGLFRMHRFDGEGLRLGRIAALIAAASLLLGVGLAAAASLLIGMGLTADAVYWLAFAFIVVAILAFAVTGAGLWKSRILPAWFGALLMLTSLLLFGFNTEDERVLLAIPFGATWMILAALLWSRVPSPKEG